ncbi:hypothetical protein F0562_015684 [Nyssa sinensis]|uniref:Uncharacterized protein n=1 Tax=Nyssa sinensis TaxID=561372 RepID=A0A5J4ZHX9_9ASTE|nr:hypothetical protein F0562_015684 [Nyssa sinensis]
MSFTCLEGLYMRSDVCMSSSPSRPILSLNLGNSREQASPSRLSLSSHASLVHSGHDVPKEEPVEGVTQV